MKNFFSLDKPFSYIDENEFSRLAKDNLLVKNIAYKPEHFNQPLSELEPDSPITITDVMFLNVSFSKTTFHNVIFRKCKFVNCLMTGSRFRRCEFHGCIAKMTNTQKFSLEHCYLPPGQFHTNIPKQSYENIYVGQFHELYNNAQNTNQLVHSLEYAWQFKFWDARENIKSLKNKRDIHALSRMTLAIVSDWAHREILGYGVKLRIIFRTAAAGLLITSVCSYFLADVFGISNNDSPLETFVDAIYYSCISLTTLGYGDFVPTTQLGKIWSAALSVLGLTYFALLASACFRRLSR